MITTPQKRIALTLTQSILLVWGGGVVANLVAALVRRAPVPAMLDLGIAVPLSVLAGLLAVTLTTSLLSRVRLEQLWQQLVLAAPFAFIAGTVASVIGIWNDGSGTVALAPLDAVLFVITGGILPTGIGPEAVVRVSVLAFCIMGMLMLRGRGLHTSRAILIGVAAWAVSSILLLSESWIVLAASIARGLAFQNALDATRILGALHTNSYWSSFQADRFLVGIGQQVDIAGTLSSLALMFLLTFGLLKLVALVGLKNRMVAFAALAKRTFGRALLILVSPLLAGLICGLHNQHLLWNGLDVIAVLVALVVFFAWFMWWHFGRDLEDLATDEVQHPNRPLPSGAVQLDELQSIRSILLIVALVGGFLLGWPVFVTLLALFTVATFSSSDLFGWTSSLKWRIPVWSVAAGLLVIFGAAVGARSAVLPRPAFTVALVWAILVGAIVWTKNAQLKSAFWLRYGFFVLLGGGWIVTLLLSR